MALSRWLCALIVVSAVAEAAPPGGAETYIVRTAPVAELHLATPKLPDLSGYTPAAAAAKIRKDRPADITVRRMVDLPALGEFVSGAGTGRLREWAKRQSTNPLAIFIDDGSMTVPELARRLPEQVVEQAPGVYLLRLPVLVDQDATLVIDKAVRELRLSQERGAFLVNDGLMFVLDTQLTAWREAEQGPAHYRSPEEFRPFLVSWGGAELYVVNSTVTSFGYSASKAYGVSISQYSPGRQKRMQRPHPTGWVLNSTFVDNWFGFYSYEADDVVILNNVYRDNIVYAIDPHDRSNHLIIANNEIYGTKKKHGLIVSREVNDSWIFGNRIHDNALSGIVIDRNSVRNVIYGNTVFDNGSDGITIYESGENLLWGNHAIGNRKHGIRVRNSVRVRLYNNVAVANARSGVYGHVKDLSGTDRNLRLDPFEQNLSLVVVGGRLVSNGSGPVSIDQPLSIELYNVDLLAPTREAGLRMSGVLGDYQHDVLDILVRRRLPVVIEPAAGAGERGSGAPRT